MQYTLKFPFRMYCIFGLICPLPFSVLVEIRTIGQRNLLNCTALLRLQAGIGVTAAQ